MKIQIPSGTRDLIQKQSLIKREMEKKIMRVFRQYCYEEVMTPAIEYYQTYARAFSSLDDTEMYKFFDDKGEILTLRMDMTVPIARLAATKFKPDSLPLRLYYSSNVYKVKKAFAGKQTEVTDCGIELIGAGDQADLEVISCALDTLETLDLPEAFLEIGDAALVYEACKKAGLNYEEQRILMDLIDRKSIVELEEYLKILDLPKVQTRFFRELPFLGGKREALETARQLCFDAEMVERIDFLLKLDSDLRELNLNERVRYDLGKIPHQNYYTGLIFQGYCKGAGHSILSGGRYDSLLEKFGFPASACGFSVKLDNLLEIVEDLPEKASYFRISYPKESQVEALKLASALRRDKPVELVQKEIEKIVLEEVK